ncbi:recombinase family protein [Planococcus shenhongbingii]|uniref:recombinase family protein n=1 Tax=Planococcus shenhongbingii TaxID=3058398 RepID=UPI002633D80F|nr:recombinase family protein [Planococcus sp. N016]WKA60296.1 recombinase family protein [Planococcus sp. N016]
MEKVNLKKKVAVYVRKSREEENGLEATLQNQRETLIRIADIKNYEYELFQEVESSIKWNRPELAKMIEGIIQGNFDRVLVSHPDRLSRDERDSAELKELFIEHGIIIETPDNIIDLTDENQELLFGFTSVLSAFEYKRIRHRLNKGKYDAVAIKNRWMGSIAPLGYIWDKNSKLLLIHPDEKPIIREMANLALSGYSSKQIADKLNALGFRTRKGILIRPDTVLRILKNRVYLGESSYNSKRLKKIATATGTHEAILTEDEFDKIQNMFISRRSRENLYSLGIKSSVNKLVACGICGKNLTIQQNTKVRKSGKTYSFFQIRPCRHKIEMEPQCYNSGCKIDIIEDAVIQSLQNYRAELEMALEQLLVDNTHELENKLIWSLTTMQSELRKHERKEQRLLDLYLDESLDKETYQNNKEQINEVKTCLMKEIKTTEGKLTVLDASAQAEKVKEVLKKIDNFGEMQLEEQNATLKLLIEKIYYVKSKDTDNKPVLDIHWREL